MGNRLFNLPRDRRERFQHNVALATRHFMEKREFVVPLKPEYSGGWTGIPLEHWEGVNAIARQFDQHIHQDPIPGVGRRVLAGAIMPDGSVFGPTHPVQPSVPIKQIDPPSSVTPRPEAQPLARLPHRRLRSAGDGWGVGGEVQRALLALACRSGPARP